MDQRRVIHRQQRQRHQPFRPQSQGPFQPLEQMHLAVATQAGGAHRHRLDHGAIGADTGALRVNRGFAAAQQADIGGGAANIADQRVGLSGQPGRPGNTRRRAGQDGFNRPVAGQIGRNQRPVATHHHQPGGDATGVHVGLTGSNQTGDQADQPGVQHRSQGTFRATQRAGQFVATGDGFAGAGNDQVMCGPFMRRVAGGKTGGHGIGGNLGAKPVQCGGQPRQIQRRHLGPGMVMPAGQSNDRIAAQRLGQTGAGQLGRIKANENQGNTAPLPFDQRIGGQCGRQRHQCHIGRYDPGLRQHRINGATHAQRQIGAGGQGFGAGQNLSLALIQQHRIGIGAPRIDAQKNRHRKPHRVGETHVYSRKRREGFPPRHPVTRSMGYCIAASVIAWVNAPTGAAVITGSDPPASSVSTVS